MKKIIPIALTAVMSFGIVSPVLAATDEVKSDKIFKNSDLKKAFL